MPTLHGVRERKPFDVYDCIERLNAEDGWPSDDVGENSRRAFGNRHIGYAALSNLQVPGRITHDDYTACVTGMYARTTIPRGPLLDQIANNTVVYLLVGCHPVRQTTLAELLRRTPGTQKPFTDPYTEADRKNEQAAMTEYLAERFAAALRVWSPRMPPLGRDQLLLLADEAQREIKPPPDVVIVPVRQNVSLTVDFLGPAGPARRDLKDGGASVSTWVHLEGWIAGERA